ncbi:MAG TPA: PP2C family protein-serine/threonine phosphatase, partial [Candidatus Acidoferrales bacterium]|nr:PP2C family protein-serine/threonine phosphatase [Candidatus Acidoferrales bacterium]
MASTGTNYAPPPAGSSRPGGKKHGQFRDYWARVTEGLAVDQLWGQMKADARSTYSFYARDVDWDTINKGTRWKVGFRIAWAFFQAMLMKLTPARRVVLLIACVFVIVNFHFGFGDQDYLFDMRGVGALLLFLLLALELADRVTMKRDLEIAREIQHWLVPEKPPVVPGVDLAFATRPQNTVAGDYYDAFLRAGPEGDAGQSLLMVVADVAGKSVPAALLMATFQASIRALAARPGNLDELARDLNRYACDHSLSGMRFTTAFIAEYDPSSRRILYINAGHNAPFLRRPSGEIVRLEEGTVPFGIDSAAEYRSNAVAIEVGDLLVIFTDGLPEAVDNSGREYGEIRLQDRIEHFTTEPAATMLASVMTDVDSYVGAARQHDDITCMV